MGTTVARVDGVWERCRSWEVGRGVRVVWCERRVRRQTDSMVDFDMMMLDDVGAEEVAGVALDL